jgi:hypothetical protein
MRRVWVQKDKPVHQSYAKKVIGKYECSKPWRRLCKLKFIISPRNIAVWWFYWSEGFGIFLDNQSTWTNISKDRTMWWDVAHHIWMHDLHRVLNDLLPRFIRKPKRSFEAFWKVVRKVNIRWRLLVSKINPSYAIFRNRVPSRAQRTWWSPIRSGGNGFKRIVFKYYHWEELQLGAWLCQDTTKNSSFLWWKYTTRMWFMN